MNDSTPLKLAVIGAGPVGLTLALHAAATLVDAEITLFDARPLDQDVAGDPRTLALSLGSVQLLQRLGAWRAESAQPISEVHVSQDAPSLLAALAPRLAEPELTIRAIDEAVPMLGAVLSYGAIVVPLQSAWLETQARVPTRLFHRFGAGVTALKNLASPAGVEVEEASGVAERFDLAVVAEGGVFSTAAKIELVADPALVDASAPRSGLVEVTLTDGQKLRELVKHAPGTPENPLDTAGVNSKARELIAPVLGSERAETLIARVGALERIGDVRELRSLLMT
jgi:2-polyprenyl-6-methoxyphenol hydroxylase-like FAD-dependent oxidoreductase